MTTSVIYFFNVKYQLKASQTGVFKTLSAVRFTGLFNPLNFKVMDFVYEVFYKGENGVYSLGLFASADLARKCIRKSYFFDNRKEMYQMKRRLLYGANKNWSLKSYVESHFGIE